MIGIWGSYTTLFLRTAATFALLVFTLPIFLFPFEWARALQWTIPEDRGLALYFGRCLGAVGCVLNGFALYVSNKPELQPFFMNIMVAVCAVLTWVHVLGAAQGVQPITETIEIVFWSALVVLALCCYPVKRTSI